MLVLAAGKGKRMHSALPKVLHPVCGTPILSHVLDSIFEADAYANVGIVVGHGRAEVESFIKGEPKYSGRKVSFIVQPEQRGTADAAKCAIHSDWGGMALAKKSSILVLPGDLPLIRPELVQEMLAPKPKGTLVRLLSAIFERPHGYGRVVRKGKKVSRIVEEKDANEIERKILEVALSIYSFDSAFMLKGLEKVKSRNAQKEFYLTDLIEIASKKSPSSVESVLWSCPDDVRGINDIWELAQAQEILTMRILEKHGRAGVRFYNPSSIQIQTSVKIAKGVEVGPGCVLAGNTVIEEGAMLGPGVALSNTRVGKKAIVHKGSIAIDSEIGEEAKVGPYAHLRPESRVGKKAKIGNFVELKKTSIGEETSVAHLSYLGDAEVGARVNIGCGFVTCNFDGRVIEGSRKHKTIIEDDVFMGSDCQVVAPIKIGKGAYVASGSTITKSVESDDLAIARSKQVNKAGYAKRLKPSDKAKE